MHKQGIALAGIVLFFIGCNAQAVRFATFNIRRAGWEAQEKHRWENRKASACKALNDIHPDILGMQEVTSQQREDIVSALSEYAVFGEPRSVFVAGVLQYAVMHTNLFGMIWEKYKAQDEQCPIFYNTNTLTLKEYGTFGINPAWYGLTSYVPRICTWGLFEEKATSKKFYVYNVHLDNTSSVFRYNQLELVLTDIKRRTHDQPVILMGDFNANMFVKGADMGLVQQLADAHLFLAKSIAQTISGPTQTRTGWDCEQLKMIDHIFMRSEQSQVLNYVVVENEVNDVMISDHRPVYTDIAF